MSRVAVVLGGNCPDTLVLMSTNIQELYKSKIDPLYKEFGIEWGFTPFKTNEENRLDIKGRIQSFEDKLNSGMVLTDNDTQKLIKGKTLLKKFSHIVASLEPIQLMDTFIFIFFAKK